MKIETIAQIVETAKYPTISAAADGTFIRQASLSALIQNAEAELGYQIFSRTKSGIQLTENGEKFIALAVELLKNYEEILQLGKSKKTAEKLTLLLNPFSNERFGADLVLKTASRYKNLSLVLRQDLRNNILKRLLSGEFRFAVDYVFDSEMDAYVKNAHLRGMNADMLLMDTRYLYVGPDSPLYDKQDISLADIKDIRLVATTTGEQEMQSSVLYSRIQNYTIVNSIHLMKSAIESGGMCAFGMSCDQQEDWITAKTAIRKKLVTDENIQAWHVLVYPKSIKLTHYEKELLTDIKSVFSGSQNI